MKKNYNNISESIIKSEIIDVLKKDGRYLVENDKVIISKVINLLIEDDKELFEELLSNKIIRDYMSIEVNGSFVFDKQKIIDIIKSNNEFIKDSFTRYANKIGLKTTNNEFINDIDDVVLNFPYKDCVLEFDSTDPNIERDEIFYNEILAKDKISKLYSNKVFSNVNKIYAVEIEKKDEKKKPNHKEFKTKEENSIEFDINDNLLIKGNNLLAMHSLLPRYEGKIKLMYWDILYNTKDDKIPYNDNFKHSSWLTMMKNRIEVAKKLLKEDGLICIQCDDNEMHYLKVLIDEIFGRDNFVDTIVNQSANSVFGERAASKDKTIVKTKDYILVYSNGKLDSINPLYTKSNSQIYDSHDFFYINNTKISTSNYFENNYKKVFDGYGLKVTKKNIVKIMNLDSDFRNKVLDDIKDIFYEAINCKEIISAFPNDIQKRLANGEIVEYNGKKYCRESEGAGNLRFLRPLSYSLGYSDDYDRIYSKVDVLGDVWNTSAAYQNISIEGGNGIELEGGKKPELIIKNLIKMFTEKNDIVLDAYFGTGTTGAVAMKMGRRFIGIEQLDKHFKLAKERLTNVINGDKTGISDQVNWQGGGSFVCVEMAQNNDVYVNRINKAKTDKELDEIKKDMIETAYISVDIDVSKIIDTEKDFEELSIKDKKKILRALLDKNHLYVNIEDIDDKEFKIDESYKLWTKSFYNI